MDIAILSRASEAVDTATPFPMIVVVAEGSGVVAEEEKEAVVVISGLLYFRIPVFLVGQTTIAMTAKVAAAILLLL